MAELLHYDHVDISYNGRAAVRDVSFTLKEKEILGIVGESGSGKSALIRAAMGLLGREGMRMPGEGAKDEGRCETVPGALQLWP